MSVVLLSVAACVGEAHLAAGASLDSQAPTTPSALRVTAVSDTSIGIGWGASSDDLGVAGYGIYKNGTLVNSTGAVSTNVSGLACGTSYTLSVDAFDSAGNRSPATGIIASTAACTGDTQAPTAPGSLSVTAVTDSSIGIGWAASSDNVGVAGYGVYRNGSRISSTGAVSTNVSALACGTSYTLSVDAFDSAGNRSGATGIVASTAACTDDTQAPTAPGSLRVTAVTDSSIGIGWSASSDNVGVSGYGVYRNGSRINSTGAVSTNVSALACGTSYTLSVDAFDSAGNRSSATGIVASTAACTGDAQAPTTPGSLRVTVVTDSSIGIGWAASSDNVGVSGYGVYRNGARINSTGAVSTNVAGLACGTSYTLAVDAFDSAGNRSGATSIVASTAGCGGSGGGSGGDPQSPTAPGSLRVTAVTDSSIGIGWAASSDNAGVAGYGVYRNGSRISSTGAVSTNVAGLACGTSYTLGVDAFDSAGNRSGVTSITASTAGCGGSGGGSGGDTQPPTTPGSLRVTAVTATSIGLGWGASSDDVGIYGYSVYRNGTRLATILAVSASVSGLACGTSYTFSVDAVDSAGNRSAATSITATTASCSSAAPPPTSSPGGSVYWGAWINGRVYGSGHGDAPWDTQTLSQFDQDAGKNVSIIHIGQGWATGGWQSFPAADLQLIRNDGAIPELDWGSWERASNNFTDPDFTDAQIASGRYDSYIRQWAIDAKNWGYPFLLRFDWEMNGSWYAWSEGGNGNQPGDYVRMWRHVHDIFTSVGANNVTWLWCVNTLYPGSVPLAGLYPGDDYVDWTGFDAYNKNVPWLTAYDLYKPVYDAVNAVAPSKPMLLESASVEAGGSKAAWISDMFSQLPTQFPKVKGIAWWNWNQDGSGIANPNYAIESSSSAQAAFAAAIADARYAVNAYAALPAGSKVQPLP